ncbi:SpvB/TcaC N-terminal domain-containing protein [Sorangium sp. So ce260]|uniref:SpvB/TcaC N-terminal domain-containing protein n=1 Tax=Sorangium sp. So ce260 TaxID=3133291 RepID=UPI003F641247
MPGPRARGNFSVTSTGEAVYELPLVSVSGRAGVEPRLALRYDSGAGEGALGVGFSIAGLSAEFIHGLGGRVTGKHTFEF